MKVLLVGDTHADITLINLAVTEAEKLKCDRILQVGDFGYYPYYVPEFVNNLQSNIPFYFIDGNHEDHDSLNHDAEEPYEVVPNFWYIPRGYITTWGNTSVLFIGGARSEDAHMRVIGMDWFPNEEINYSQFNRCFEGNAPDVIISHEAPATPINDYPEPSYSKQAINNLVDFLSPALLIHGHHHINYMSILGITVIKGLGCTPNDMFEVVYF